MKNKIKQLEEAISVKDAALKATLPALYRLGDFIGNVEEDAGIGIGRIDRCEIIGRVKDAIGET